MSEPPVPSGFRAAAAALGVELDNGKLEQLAAFVRLLLEANARFNLTSVREPEEVWSRHVLDSLSLVPWLELPTGASLVDVGSGGGLPGLVLAIVRPDLSFTLVDATGKKVRHLSQCAQALGLTHVQALQGRAEELAGFHRGAAGPMREAFDAAVARALAPLPVLLELVIPFVRPGGRFLAIKGERADEELAQAGKAMRLLHVELTARQRVQTGTILQLRKTAHTPRKYPRRPGEPKRAPL